MTLEHIAMIAREYARRFPKDGLVIQELLGLVATGADISSRKEFRGHVTCGAIVITPDGRFLMVHHRILDRWLFPGGHLEEMDVSLRMAALRELTEETGLDSNALTGFGNWLDHGPVHVDCHPIPANSRKQEPEHRHWDFQFAFRGDVEITSLQIDEVIAYDYVGPERLPEVVLTRLQQSFN